MAGIGVELIHLIQEVFSPDFLLRNSLYVNLLVGFAVPLVGVFLVLRRMVFLGVALPAVSSSGIALALSLHVWFGHYEGGHGEQEQEIAFLGSFLFTLAAILWLSFMDRKGRSFSEGRIGMAYVLATAASLLLLAKCPAAERGWFNLFRGEIIAISTLDLTITVVTLVVVVLCIAIFKKDFLLVSFDPEMARTLRKRVTAWDFFLYLLIGSTIAVSVLSVGPLIAFGFMVIPPLIAHAIAQNMRQFFWFSSLIGGMSSILGFLLSYQWDLPVGPTNIAVLGGLYLIISFGKSVMRKKQISR